MTSAEFSRIADIETKIKALKERMDECADSFHMLESKSINANNAAEKKLLTAVECSAQIIELSTVKHEILVSNLPKDVKIKSTAKVDKIDDGKRKGKKK
jgi:23S rRNA G2445 N2-methylase RlmL